MRVNHRTILIIGFLVLALVFRVDDNNIETIGGLPVASDSQFGSTMSSISEFFSGEQFNDFSAEDIDNLRFLVIDLETRATDAEALLSLSELELQALDRRLREGETQRNIFWTLIGAIIGLVVEWLSSQLVKIFKRNNIEETP